VSRIVGCDPELSLAERQAFGKSLAVLIGPAPLRAAHPCAPMIGKPGERIAELAGLEYPHRFSQVFDRVNLFERVPDGSDGDGGGPHSWPSAEAVLDLEPELRGRVVVALGRGVATSFGIRPAWYSWRVMWRLRGRLRSLEWAPLDKDDPFRGLEEAGESKGLFLVACAPQPARLSRYWDDPSARSVDEGFWRCLVTNLTNHYAPGGT